MKNIRNIAILALVAIGAVLFVYFFAMFQTPNSGQHAGYITAVEESGLLFHTWIAYVKTDPQSSQEDAYCVTDSRVIASLQSDAEDRTPVTVYYAAPVMIWKWQCESPSSIINAVQVVGQSTTTAQ